MNTAYTAFKEINPDVVKESIHQAITLNDSTKLQKCINDFDTYFFGIDHFPKDIFNFLISLLYKNNVLNMNGSWHLLMSFQYNWELLSDEQKTKLILTLESVYIKFKDRMSLFVISELLGENFRNEQALQVLCKLKNLTSEEHRSFVPHGLEHIVRDSQDKNLSEKAYFELLQMKKDTSEQVRYEVNLSIQRIEVNKQSVK